MEFGRFWISRILHFVRNVVTPRKRLLFQEHGSPLLGQADRYPQVICWTQGGVRSIWGRQLPSFDKEGWPRHQLNGPVPYERRGRGGWFNFRINRWLEPTTVDGCALSGLRGLRPRPSAPAKEASRLLLMGAAPLLIQPLPRRGVFRVPNAYGKYPNFRVHGTCTI